MIRLTGTLFWGFTTSAVVGSPEKAKFGVMVTAAAPVAAVFKNIRRL
jgi:hypothetical protein